MGMISMAANENSSEQGVVSSCAWRNPKTGELHGDIKEGDYSLQGDIAQILNFSSAKDVLALFTKLGGGK